MAREENKETEGPVARPLDLEKIKKSKQKGEKKRGIIYLSTIPPYMKPEKVRHLLGQFGDIDRIYLVPEDQTQYRRRVQAGGNKKMKYVEGWVEFLDRKVAKSVADMLNNTKVGGKKRSFYHEDVWLMKYLPKFTWAHLTEKIAYDSKLKQEKLRLEVAHAKRESQFYADQIEKAKQLTKMEERKKARTRTESPGTKKADEDARNEIRRRFKQKAPAADPETSDKRSSSDAVLQSIFAKRRKTESGTIES